MRRFYAIAVAALSVLVPWIGASGETVTHKEAKTWAQTFFNAARGEVTAPVKMVYNGKDLTTQRLFTPFFIYNSPRGGFVIISGENKLMPVLGYSLTGSFDPSKMDPATRALLKEYARQIELIRYDSDVSEKAVEAWRNRNVYLNSILTSDTFSGFSIPDAEEETQEFALMMSDLPFDDSMRSDIYTPDQWEELLDDQMKTYGSAVIGIGEGSIYNPAVAVGKSGDYVKIAFDGSETAWNMLLFPTDLYSFGFIGRLGGEPVYPDEPVEAPFAFHDEVMEMYPAETRAASSIIEEFDSPSKPVVRSLGAGHFEIDYPSPIRLLRVFNVAGQAVLAQTYGGSTQTAVVNIEDQPGGFYVIVAQSDEGPQEALKVAR